MIVYSLVDFESVQPDNLVGLVKAGVRVMIFVGANQTKLPVELVADLQPWGKRVHYIKMAGQGRNALDFHIAYYLGWLSRKNREAQFYIVSKDKGFDPLVSHLRANGIAVSRIDSLSVDAVVLEGNIEIE